MADASISILLVEDNEIDALLFQRAVKFCRLPWQVTTINDGVEAIEYLRGAGKSSGPARPRLVFLDWKMPGIGGREVLTAIRADASLNVIPVIAFTSSDDHSDIMEAYRLGANSYVRKPPDTEQLKHVVKAIDSFWFGVVLLPPYRVNPRMTP